MSFSSAVLPLSAVSNVDTAILFVRFVQDIRDKFWKSGGILELPVAFRRKLQMEDGSRLSYEKLVGAQDLVLESLSSYW